jgi:hypothetical protein
MIKDNYNDYSDNANDTNTNNDDNKIKRHYIIALSILNLKSINQSIHPMTCDE